MPAKPRSEIFDASEVGVYHCWNRLVRRRCLFGVDKLTGVDHRHRKDWVREQYRLLAAEMAIQILDYAILDNHLHVVLCNRPDIVESWSDYEVALRWWRVCPRRRLKDGAPADPKDCEIKLLLRGVGEYRRRLSDISWMMRLAQQRVARRSNKEDKVDGRFFAHRFECVRLADEESVLRCSLYVDLNVIHAGLAETPEDSRYTSAFERIIARKRKMDDRAKEIATQEEDHPDAWLAPVRVDEQAEQQTCRGEAHIAVDDGVDSLDSELRPAISRPLSNPIGASRVSDKGFLRMTEDEYFYLLDTVGRVIRHDKIGSIPKSLPPIFSRLGVEPKKWMHSVVEMFSISTKPISLGRT